MARINSCTACTESCIDCTLGSPGAHCRCQAYAPCCWPCRGVPQHAPHPAALGPMAGALGSCRAVWWLRRRSRRGLTARPRHGLLRCQAQAPLRGSTPSVRLLRALGNGRESLSSPACIGHRASLASSVIGAWCYQAATRKLPIMRLAAISGRHPERRAATTHRHGGRDKRLTMKTRALLRHNLQTTRKLLHQGTHLAGQKTSPAARRCAPAASARAGRSFALQAAAHQCHDLHTCLPLRSCLLKASGSLAPQLMHAIAMALSAAAARRPSNLVTAP